MVVGLHDDGNAESLMKFSFSFLLRVRKRGEDIRVFLRERGEYIGGGGREGESGQVRDGYLVVLPCPTPPRPVSFMGLIRCEIFYISS